MNKFRMVQIPNKAKVFHFDLTTRCNLKCPMCPRVTAKLKVKKDFDVDLLNNVPIEEAESLLLCGRTGDPIMYPELFTFLEICKQRAPNTRIDISTNGAARNGWWWEALAETLQDINHNVIFCIDGLRDKLSIYRKGANYNRLIKNADTFIKSGGHATWKFVAFEHNEHQLDEALEISKSMGFKEFIPIFSFHYGEGFNKPTRFLELETKYERANTKGTYIHCRMEKIGEFFITYDGYVISCCHINPAREDGFFDNMEKMNLKDHTFNEIRESNYFKKLGIKILFYPLCNNFCRTRIDRWANTRLNVENKKGKSVTKDKPLEAIDGESS